MHRAQAKHARQRRHAKQAAHATHSRISTDRIVITQPAIRALPAVATDPATAALPAVATDPATAALLAVLSHPRSVEAATGDEDRAAAVIDPRLIDQFEAFVTALTPAPHAALRDYAAFVEDLIGDADDASGVGVLRNARLEPATAALPAVDIDPATATELRSSVTTAPAWPMIESGRGHTGREHGDRCARKRRSPRLSWLRRRRR